MKKIFFSLSLVLTILFSTTVITYATKTGNNDIDAIGNSMKNIVGGAENKVEDTARDAADATKKATNSMGDAAGKAGENIKNSAQDIGNGIKDGAENVGNAVENATEDMKNGAQYTAERTAAETNNAGNNFMNSTTWAWIVIGVIVVAIEAIFWYYMVQSRK